MEPPGAQALGVFVCEMVLRCGHRMRQAMRPPASEHTTLQKRDDIDR